MDKIKLICFFLVFVMLAAFVSCGLTSGTDDGPGTPSVGNDKKSDVGSRVTYYDNVEGMKWASALQNSRLSYSYGEDHDDGRGTVSLPFEFINCADYHYHMGYTVSGFSDALDGDLPEPDDHTAVVFKDGKGTLYDFYRKLIVDDYPYPESDEERVFLPVCPESDAFNVFYLTKDYEQGSKQIGDSDLFCERIEMDSPNALCNKARSCELRSKIISRENPDFVCEYKEYVFSYDPDTEVTLHADFYLVSDTKYAIDEKTSLMYAYRESSILSVLDVKEYSIGTVTPQNVLDRISEVMSGHESEYKHISFGEYNEIFA